MGWLDEAPDKEKRVALLVALRDITDGKIYVEAERAKLTRMLAAVRVFASPCTAVSARSSSTDGREAAHHFMRGLHTATVSTLVFARESCVPWHSCWCTNVSPSPPPPLDAAARSTKTCFDLNEKTTT